MIIYAKNHHLQKQAQAILYKARYTDKSIVLKKQKCEQCNRNDTLAHHDDYAKPFEIRWLCPSHHLKWHSKRSLKSKKPNGSQLNIRISADLIELLKIKAKSEGRSMNKAIERVLKEYVTTGGNENDNLQNLQ